MGLIEQVGLWESIAGVIIFGILALLPSKYLTKKYEDPNNLFNKKWFRIIFGIAALISLINVF
jgi:hypothetical protein